MANVYNGNTFLVEASSSSGDATSYVDEKGILVSGVIISCETAGDLTLHDLKLTNGTYGAGDKKLHLNCVAKETYFLNLNDHPIVFPNGIWAANVDTGATTVCTLILKRKG